MPEAVLIVAALLSLANGVALLLVNSRRMINRVFFSSAIVTCAWLFCMTLAIRTGRTSPPDLPNPTLQFWVRMCSATPVLILWHIAAMRTLLWEDISNISQLLKRTWIWAGISIALSVLALTESYIPAYSTTLNKARGPAYLPVMGICLAGGVWLIIDTFRRGRQLQGVRKLEARFFVFNSCAASILVIFCSLGSNIVPELIWLRRLGPLCVCLWHGLTVWSICHHRIFDARHVVYSLGQRLLLLGSVGAIAAALAQALNDVLGLWPGIMFATVTACGLTMICDRPMRKWFGLDSAHRLMRPRETIIEWAKQAPGEEKLRHHFEGLLREWCQTDRATLLPLRDTGYSNGEISLNRDWEGLLALVPDGGTTPESLQRRREATGTKTCQEFLGQHLFCALLAVPHGSPEPSLLVAVGQKTSLRPYTYPDIQLLLELAKLMDNVLTHARVAARNAQIEKMESASMMSRGLAHDLNNLATPVSAFLLHMESRVSSGSNEAEVLSDAKHSIRVMQEYIRESMFFARRLVPEFRLLSVGELLVSTAKVCQGRAQDQNVEIVIDNPADIQFSADRVLMQRLLQNLVFNGVDASPPGGKVTLSAIQHDDRVTISVTDQGPGVPDSIRDRIFEPYFTTKDTGDKMRGLGLGLAICLKIGDLHGANLKVGQAPSGGAVFSVTLPLSQRPPVTSLPAPASSATS